MRQLLSATHCTMKNDFVANYSNPKRIIFYMPYEYYFQFSDWFKLNKSSRTHRAVFCAIKQIQKVINGSTGYLDDSYILAYTTHIHIPNNNYNMQHYHSNPRHAFKPSSAHYMCIMLAAWCNDLTYRRTVTC